MTESRVQRAAATTQPWAAGVRGVVRGVVRAAREMAE